MKLSTLLFSEAQTSSKQSILNLGFPDMVAAMFLEMFGKNAFLLARWYKEYIIGENLGNKDTGTDWWKRAKSDWNKVFDPVAITQLYTAASVSLDAYYDERVKIGADRTKQALSNVTQPQVLEMLKRSLKETLFETDSFFRAQLIVDIMSGKVANLQPYKSLSLADAEDKYDNKRVFRDAEPFKAYPNGWRWINVGKQCQLVGKQMRNCGSTGLMSADANKSMLVLFDNHDKSHVVATLSPTDGRISGFEGAASTQPKSEYDDYMIDLIKTLGLDFDYHNTKSKTLKLKVALAGKYKSVEQISAGGLEELFKVVSNSGVVYYTNSFDFVTEQELRHYMETNPNSPNDLVGALTQVMHHTARGIVKAGLNKVAETMN